MSAPVATIRLGGAVLDPEVEVLSIEVRKEVGRVPEARLVLLDGSVAERRFAVSDDDFFALGNRITISVRHERGTDAQIFEGVVVRQIVEASAGGSELRVELRDPAHRLTRQRRSAVYRHKKDHEVFRELVGKARPDLKIGTVKPTTAKNAELVQYQATDWDFLQARADASASVIVVDDGVMSLHSLRKPPTAAVELEYGLDDIFSLELELDGTQQWRSVESTAWDAAGQALAAPVAAADVRLGAGDLDVAALAGKLGGEACLLYVPGALQTDELGAWADGRLARSRLSLLRGSVALAGRADIKPFSLIKLGGVGKRFNGELLVSGVVQRVDLDGWRTELQIGLSPDLFAQMPDVNELPAGGLVPAVTGLQLGTVLGFEKDPSDEVRIKVRLAGLAAEDDAVWARLARPDAGGGRGFVFWPEARDEVVVGFLAGDPRQAIVLGSLHGSANPPPDGVGAPNEDNHKRGIVGRGGTSVVFDDDKHALTISTPAGNRIVVDDDAESVRIEDLHGNRIVMNKDGIKLTSVKDLTLAAAGKVVIEGETVDIA